MNILDQLEEIKELVNEDKKFKYKNIVNFNCEDIKEELDYASKCHNLEEELGCPLDEAINVLFETLKFTELYQCITCTSVRHNERGCEGNCEHNKEFSKKEILNISKRYVNYYNTLKKDKGE